MRAPNPFFAAAGLAFANALYGLVVLPESLPEAQRRRFELSRANPIGALAEMRRYPIVTGLFVVLFFYQIAHAASPSSWSYYTTLAFDWTTWEVGYSLGAAGVLFALVQGVVIRLVIPHIGEARTVYVGFFAMAFGFFGWTVRRNRLQDARVELPAG